MPKITLTALKKRLAQKSKEELIKEIATLYQTFPQVKEYYQAQGSDVAALLEKYKQIIEKEFIMGNRRTPPNASFAVARKALNDFKKLTKEPELIADIMLTYVECTSDFNNEFGPNQEDYYVRPEDMFEKTLAYMQKHDLLDTFRLRAQAVVNNATEGWGHKDTLNDHFYTFYIEN